MAIIHKTTLTPGKLELLTSWLPGQPWYLGAGREPRLAKAGGFRLDDPQGEVGIDFMVVTDEAGDRPISYHVPLTYRGAPLDGADQALIGTAEHGALGRRWIYDGSHDPVLVTQLLALFVGRAEPQAQSVSETPDPSVATYLSGPGLSAVVKSMTVADGPHGTDLSRWRPRRTPIRQRDWPSTWRGSSARSSRFPARTRPRPWDTSPPAGACRTVPRAANLTCIREFNLHPMLPASDAGNIGCRLGSLAQVGDGMPFVGRSQELDRLRDWWEHDPERPALVWGRRRVGKTALIQRFADELPRVIFHTGVAEPPEAELAALSRQVATIFPSDIRDLAVSPYRDWHDALDHLARAAQDEPLLLVLDEFPELIATAPALPGILRAFLDRSIGKTRLRLLICGSAVRTMWSIQQTRAPLYGRFNLALPLHPFRPHEAAMMLPDLMPADRARAYGIVGGMPLYLRWWKQHLSVSENVSRLACQPGSPLLTEGKLIMLTEVGAEKSAETLYAIAAGRTRHHEIEDVIHADPSRVLDRLIEARLIERVIPVTEDPLRSRRRIYRIADNFLSFYLGPLLRYRGEIERGQGDNVLPAVMNRLDEHMGPAYEEAFRDHLWRLAARGELGDGVISIGSWWNRDGQDQIDAVALAEPDHTRVPVLAGEAKWGRRVDAARITAKLRVKAASLTDDVDTLRYAVCAREEIVHADKDTLLVTAEDIFAPE